MPAISNCPNGGSPFRRAASSAILFVACLSIVPPALGAERMVLCEQFTNRW